MPSLHAFLHTKAKNKNNRIETKTQVFKFINIKPKISTVIHKKLLTILCAFEGLVLVVFFFLTSLIVYTIRTIILIAY